MPSRRAVIAALLGGSVGAATLTDAQGYLDRFAPLSGSVWGAATASTRERVATPFGRATVRYDDAGVPTVQATNDQSLYFAVGYVHAADRLFEMDLIRRRMRGTLSAAVGEQTVDSDRFHVQMDFAGAAAASWQTVQDTETGDAMRAYAAGVEAYRTSESLPLEFRLLGYEPAATTAITSRTTTATNSAPGPIRSTGHSFRRLTVILRFGSNRPTAGATGAVPMSDKR